MPTLVQIIIEGLALCYRKGNDWNVIFVCDPSHPLTLTDPSGGPPVPLRVTGHDFECRFTGDIANRTASAYPNSLFNLNGQQAHDGRLIGVKRDHGLQTQVIEMILPNAEFRVLSSTSPQYYIQEVGAGTGPVQIGPVAEKMIAEFTLQSGPLTLRVGNPRKEQYKKGFMDIGGTFRFRFNNHCGGACHRNDSIDLYDIMIDADQDRERRFVTGILDNSGNVPGHQSVAFSFDENARAFTGPYGNCDPMGSEPPIG